MLKRILSWLLGPPLRTEASGLQSVGVGTGIALLGLDALASAAYGPEAALTVLLPLGAAGTGYLVPLSVAIVLLLLIIQLSYRQTIAAYPDAAGSYLVARTNLGSRTGLFAAAALWIDLVLNVAVAVAAGVGALVSAVPFLAPHTLAVCLVILLVLTAVNLRGTRDTALMLALPTALFVGCLFAVLVLGAFRAMGAGGVSWASAGGASAAGVSDAVSPWLLLRAFASGCTAMTGVEAVSNAVPVFGEPRVIKARRTLSSIVAILSVLVLGEAILCAVFRIAARPPGDTSYESVLSQLTRVVVGRTAFYYVTMAAVVAVLCLSANTSFAAFPRLCEQLAVDGYLPSGFAHRGPRLVYSRGIVLLSLLAGALLVAWRGVTDRLVPLFAVGALLAFTLSQAGMVAHWYRARGQAHRRRALAINAVGTIATGATLGIVLVAKFSEGAWLTVVALMALMVVFGSIEARNLARTRVTASAEPLDLQAVSAPIIVVPLTNLDRVTQKALRFSLALSKEVTALQVLAGDPGERDLSHDWEIEVEAPCRQAGHEPPKLVVLRSSLRRLVDPIVEHVRRTALVNPQRSLVIVLPELGARHWYHFIFGRVSTAALRARLLLEGGPNVIVANVYWYPEEADRRGRGWGGKSGDTLPQKRRSFPRRDDR